MARLTVALDVTKAWQPIANGTQTLTVSVKAGQVLLVDAESTPAAGSSLGHMAREGGDAWVITPPSKVWVRSILESAQIMVSGE